MPKMGIFQDYDLQANESPGAKRDVACVVCGDRRPTYQWSDCSGEGMCIRCGTPYQLQWGTEDEQAEGAYPYLKLLNEWIPIVREYWEETQQSAYLGTFIPPEPPGKIAFFQWVETNHPEMLELGDDNDG